jgi:hypothetical protein
MPRYSPCGAKRERKYSSYSFLTSAIRGVNGQHYALAALYPRESTSGIHWIGGWVGVRTGLDTQARGKIFCPCWRSNSTRAVCSQTLYWLSYPSYLSQLRAVKFYNISGKCFVLPPLCAHPLWDTSSLIFTPWREADLSPPSTAHL